MMQYFDTTLATRGRKLKEELEAKANADLEKHLGEETLADIRADAQEKLDELEGLTEEINEQLTVDPFEFDIEDPEDLEILEGDTDISEHPLVDTDDWEESTENMRRRKQYADV